MRRHPLFFLGFKMSDQGAGQGGPLRRWLRRRRAAAAAARARGRQPGKRQGSVPVAAAVPSEPALARHSSEHSLREQWREGGATSAPASSAGADVATGLEEEDWAEHYYGSFGSATSPALRSPHLPAFGSLPAAAAGAAEAGAPTAPPPPPLPRKPTSLRLAVCPEPLLPGSDAGKAASMGGNGTTGEEEGAEGPDVAAERSRAEALWQQW